MEIPTEMVQFIWAVAFVWIVIWILFARTVKGLLERIKDENRFLQPAQAWLLVIPFFNMYWNFVAARAISNSLNNEFFDRKIAEEEFPGLSAGMVYAWMFMLAHLFVLPAFMVMTFAFLSFIYFIRYWVKVYHFKLLLEEHDKFLEKQ